MAILTEWGRPYPTVLFSSYFALDGMEILPFHFLQNYHTATMTLTFVSYFILRITYSFLPLLILIISLIYGTPLDELKASCVQYPFWIFRK